MDEMMITFELEKNDVQMQEEIKKTFIGNYSEATVDSFDGNDILQIFIPLVVVLSPAISSSLQKYFENSRVTIKYEEIELSVMGYKKATKMLKELLNMKESENESTE